MAIGKVFVNLVDINQLLFTFVHFKIFFFGKFLGLVQPLKATYSVLCCIGYVGFLTLLLLLLSSSSSSPLSLCLCDVTVIERLLG